MISAWIDAGVRLGGGDKGIQRGINFINYELLGNSASLCNLPIVGTRIVDLR